MTPELEALARRAVACKGWRWMAGMRIQNSVSGPRGRVYRVDPGAVSAVYWMGEPDAARDGGGIQRGLVPLHSDIIPDLTDPCTLGGLLALVREAWDIPEMGTRGHNEACDEWVVAHCGGPITMPVTTEAAALVAALEAAP